jgi:hypothetical protein
MARAATTWLDDWRRDSTLPTVPQMGEQVLGCCKRLTACQTYSKRVAGEYADATRDYRLEKAKLILQAGPALIADGIEKPTVAERGAWVDLRVANLKHALILAEEMKWANQQAVKNLQAELSALQSLLSAYKDELRFVRSGGNG